MWRVAIILLSVLAVSRSLKAQEAAIAPAQDVASAIERGLKSKQWEGVRDGSPVWGSLGRGFAVTLTGPLNRVANAAAEHARKYMPYTVDSVAAEMLEPVVVVTAFPWKPQVVSGKMHVTPAATHLVIMPGGKGERPVTQPDSTNTFTETWNNAFGAEYTGQGIRAVFQKVPEGDMDIVVITGAKEYRASIKSKDRGALR
jgi:hypothetical protein